MQIPRLGLSLLISGLALLITLPCTAAGPMLGDVGMKEARVWLQTPARARVRLQYWPAAHPAQIHWTAAFSTQAEHQFALTLVLPTLEPGTAYRYRIERDGRLLPGDYGFTTQPDWIRRSDPPPVRIALGSCVYLNDPAADPPGSELGGDYRIFQAIAATHPQLMLWLGDNMYLRPADFYAASAIDARYRQARNLPEMQTLLQTAANYAVWDDHDYGDNDSDRSYRLREDSLALFRDYWANPAYGLPEQPGVFHRFVWSDVEFFMTDNRYMRAPNRLADPNRDYFGPRQLQWLKDSLVNSTATFKLIVIGNQVLNTHSPSENFYSYQQEFRQLLAWLESARIPGVVILSGDRHHSELFRLQRPGLYPLYDWTVSPLTSSAYAPFETEKDLPERVPGSLLVERNFGLIDVSGPLHQRRLRLQLFDASGRSRWRFSLSQAELTPP